VSNRCGVQFPEHAWQDGQVTISERVEADRRERRVRTRVSRAAWRLEHAERERVWALVSARAEAVSIRKLAAAAGLSPSRVHQLVANADMTVGRLALGDDRHPAHRIFVDVGDCSGCDGSGWSGLTVAEARRVAWALLSQAAAAEWESQAQTGPAGRVTVCHVGGDAYAVSVRGHAVLVDQPEADGGRDAAATPTELLVASLASCVAFYAGRYLLRHGLDRSGLAVTADFTMASGRPAHVGEMRLRISVPSGIPPQRRDALLAVASHCTVHNTLRQQPGISIELD
jgi:putative redox protein